MTGEPLLALEHVAVHFGGLKAISDLSLAVRRGGLHGLIGPNGAGKTTAMNVICGQVRLTTGAMRLEGEPFRPRPHLLAARGLARGFQSSATIAGLSALENVLLGGFAATRAGILSGALQLPGAVREEAALRTRAEAALEAVGYAGSRAARIAGLSTWQRRQIEIARALLAGPKLLLLDEPAAGLTTGEVADLKRLLRRLCDDGLSILLIEHNVPLVFSLCDEVTAMTEGRDVAHGAPAAVRAHPDVIRSYLGAAAATPARTAAGPPPLDPAAPVLLELRDVSAGYDALTVLHRVSLTVRRGETVALFGPNGAGKTTLLHTIVGERRVRGGSVTWRGERIERRPIQDIVRAGIGLVPQGRAVMERHSVEDNLVTATTGLGLGRAGRARRLDDMFTRFPSLARRRRSLGASLSGGERQMLAIARALVREPALLLLDEPSIGLAPTVVDDVQRIVAELGAAGLTVVIGEQSVGWVLPVAHRAYAIAAGRIVAAGDPASLSDADTLAARYLSDAAA